MILLSVVYCSGNTEKKAGVIADVEGVWEIVPSLESERIVISGSEAYASSQGSRTKLEASFDAIGLRLMKNGQMAGYFLVQEKSDSGWKGLWNEQIVTLRKISQSE